MAPPADAVHDSNVDLRRMQRLRRRLEVRHDRSGPRGEREAQQDEERCRGSFDDAQSRSFAAPDRPEQARADADQRDHVPRRR